MNNITIQEKSEQKSQEQKSQEQKVRRKITKKSKEKIINLKFNEEDKKDWIIKKISNNNNDILVIDNYYSEKELKNVFTEIYYYMNCGLGNLIASENDKATAHNLKGESLAKTYRFYVERNKYSVLYKYSKYATEKFAKMVESNFSFGKYLTNTDNNFFMVNYYENGEYYNSHKDISVVSQLTWLYHEPKMFTGGNVIFSDMNETIECLHNRSVFFPGHYQHEVQEVNMNDNFKKEDFDNQYYGSFSIDNFFKHR
jgi:Rps23 Pro-64 3,4-dihydroxylase Tpa1-like proline 4-hydroxylase